MSFMFYDLIFLVAFTLFVVSFLYTRRKNLKREGPMFLYRTQIGMKIIEYIGEKHKKLLHWLEYVVITAGYFLMAASIASIGYVVYVFVKMPEFFKVAKIPPIAPLIPYIGEIFNADYLPPFYFTYWIVVLAITAIFHEFFHGIFAKKNNVKIRSTGFAFLGPFLGAFVEQDEKQMKKLKFKGQVSILAAGSFANLLLTLIFLVIIVLFSIFAFAPAGANFNYYPVAKISVSDVSYINGTLFSINLDGGINLTEITANNKTYFAEPDSLKKNLSEMIIFEDSPALRAGVLGIVTEFYGKKINTPEDLRNELEMKNPGDEVSIKFLVNKNEKESRIILGARPDNSSKAYLGVANLNVQSSGIFGKIRKAISFFREPNTYYAPKGSEELVIFIYNLLWWIILINLSVALFNMLPVGIFDGGRVFYLTVLKITKSKKMAQRSYSLVTYLFIAIFALLTIMWLASYFMK